MNDFDEWLVRRLPAEDALRFNAIVVPVSPGASCGLIELLGAWWLHLSKFEADLWPSVDDHSVWGAHDYIAALVLRDHLAQAMLLVEPSLVAQITSIVSAVDQRFVDFTESDDDGCVERVDGRDDLVRDWWWSKVPRRGPIREELRFHYGHAEMM